MCRICLLAGVAIIAVALSSAADADDKRATKLWALQSLLDARLAERECGLKNQQEKALAVRDMLGTAWTRDDPDIVVAVIASLRDFNNLGRKKWYATYIDAAKKGEAIRDAASAPEPNPPLNEEAMRNAVQAAGNPRPTRLSHDSAATVIAMARVADEVCPHLMTEENGWTIIAEESVSDFWDKPGDERLVYMKAAEIMTTAKKAPALWCESYDKQALADIDRIRRTPEGKRQNIQAALCFLENGRVKGIGKDCPEYKAPKQKR